MKFKDAGRMKESTLKRFLRLPRFDEHLELHRLDCASANRNLESYELVKRKLAEFPDEHLKPQPLTGRRFDCRRLPAGSALCGDI